MTTLRFPTTIETAVRSGALKPGDIVVCGNPDGPRAHWKWHLVYCIHEKDGQACSYQCIDQYRVDRILAGTGEFAPIQASGAGCKIDGRSMGLYALYRQVRIMNIIRSEKTVRMLGFEYIGDSKLDNPFKTMVMDETRTMENENESVQSDW